MDIQWLWRTLILFTMTSHEISGENEWLRDTEKDSLNLVNQDENEFQEFSSQLPSEEPHLRRKRLIWVTDDGRLALPPGTHLTLTPTISLPLVRYPPEGFLSNISISLPLSIDFDTLGLTDNQNPLGELPPIFARSFGRATGEILGNYISNYMTYRKKRELRNEPKINNDEDDDHFTVKINNDEIIKPELPKEFKNVFHGGERALLYTVVEDFLTTLGVNGKACLLRTICEVHSLSLKQYGFLGEVLKLFLTVTNSPFSEHLSEYVKAQQIGEGKMKPGECFPYYKKCSKGLFKSTRRTNRYREDHLEYSENSNEIFQNDEENIEGYSKRMKDFSGNGFSM